MRESTDRLRAALQNAGFGIPNRRITINLAPADLPNESGRFDLPIALGILAALGQIPGGELDRYEFAGELSPSGELGLDWCHGFHVANGEVAKFKEYGDTHKAALAYQAAGAMPGVGTDDQGPGGGRRGDVPHAWPLSMPRYSLRLRSGSLPPYAGAR